MRHTCSFLLLCAVSTAAGQSPVIGTAQFFEFGQSYLRDDYIPPQEFENELVQASGPDYAIDLSPVSSMFLYQTDEVIRGSALDQYTWYSDYYDTANTRVSVYYEQGQLGFGTFLFLEDEEGIHYVGGAPNGSTWTSELVWMRFPDNGFPLELQDDISFGFTHLDSIQGEFVDGSGSDDHYVNGRISVEADGYGTITMPDGLVIPNTLRLRSTRAYVDSNLTFGVNAITNTLYTWYAEGISGPVMALEVGSFGLADGYATYLPLSVYRQSGEQAIASRPGVPPPLVFPNPFAERAQLTWSAGAGDETVTITDVQGRVVQRDRLRVGRLHLEGARFAPGLYTYVIGGGREQLSAHGKFVVR